MADWKLVTEPVAGKCPKCSDFIRHCDILISWRNRTFHLGCLLDILTEMAPAPNPYSLPGADWQAP